MKKEIESLQNMGTFEVVDRPVNEPVIGCRWVYKIKRTPSGGIDKFKARLVAQGFSQEYSVNYFETYAPVVKSSTMRLLMAVAVKCNFKIEQIDIRNAYVNSDLNEDIYMRQPPGFCDNTNRVIKLKKSLYGLKQSGKMWNSCLNNVLVQVMKYCRLKTDPCVYYKGIGPKMIIVAVYVDDFLILARDDSDIREFKRKVSQHFEVDDIGECRKIIGVNVEKCESSIVLHQKPLISELIKKCKLESAYTVKTPLNTAIKLNQCTSPGQTNECNKVDGTRVC